jgi:cell wall-associated NlpC family hydrolase
VGDANAIIKAAHLRELAVRYAWAWIRTPYIWGGNDFAGIDCSGLMVEILTGVGLLRHKEDLNANGLYIRWQSKAVARPYAGCLCFWFNPAGIATHVELVVDDLHTIGASGGGSATTTPGEASAQDAFVKLRPIGYRGLNQKFLDPFLET